MKLERVLGLEAGLDEDAEGFEVGYCAGAVVVCAWAAGAGVAGGRVHVGTDDDCGRVSRTEEGVVLEMRGLLPRLLVSPGILAMTEGWLKRCLNCCTVIPELADAMDLTLLKSQLAASVPVEDW